MSEPVRSIIFFADENGVSPSEPQFAGVQGEHNATEVKFQLSSALTSPEYLYRIEFSDAAGEYDSTDFIPISGSFVNYLLPESWTKAGGVGVIHLCAVVLDASGQEEQEVYSLAGRLKFAPRESGGMKTKYEKGLSALISEAGKATDAANEAAESANAAADKVDEAVSSANAATANANRAAASADASAATASAAAGGAQEAKEAADTAASGANTAAEQARTAAASANTAAGTADTAASNANAVADAVQAKLDAGELKGEKGDTGPEGPQGVSGVYVGGGDMPEGYTVQVDPTGDMMCYTAGESDSRYANVLAGAASGPVAALEDVSPTGALRRAAVLGATAETGEGDKSPDNPYTLAGVQPTKVTVCGKNLLDSKAVNGSSNGVTWTVQSDGCIKVTGTATGTVTIDILPPRNTPYFWMSQGYTPSGSVSLAIYAIKEDGTKEYGAITNLGIRLGLTPVTGKVGILRVYKQYLSGDAVDETIYPYIGLEPDSPYAPYAGQTIDLPALAPLHGDGTVCDEYDAATGVENRRWGRVELDGTEAWITRTSGAGVYGYALPDVFDAPAAAGVCTHFSFVKNGASGTQTAVCVASASTRKDLSVFTTIATLDDFKAWLSARATAGTPVTVLYQLAEPVITQHDPARILPPAPVCRVFADAGGVDVGYNRDINIAFEQQQAEYIAQIKALDARIAKLETGQPAEPMT